MIQSEPASERRKYVETAPENCPKYPFDLEKVLDW